ncbi:rod shape-determining protein MreD [Pelagibacteraceae bacterium]|nr:rod shape-determining protein MreD [Pelagibacteraceae bacterium]MDC0366317.1 rod shape-determining protein MreD [Pelagibacteraceae bacterium]|tara:strand:- start:172 stop:684 length:513 start_codon:yes stop_codon:yes gene_type:complete
MLHYRTTRKLINFGPVILLYYLSISEIDTYFENFFEILSFNIQLIIVYFWSLKRPEVIGNGNIFFAGLINDTVMGTPLGLSSLSYLVVSLVATYVKNMTVNTSITTDWFTFFIAICFSNLTILFFLNSFSILSVSFIEISYNTFFSLIFYPFFWLFFNFYNTMITMGKNV